MYSFFKSPSFFPWQRPFLALLTTKTSSRLMGSTFMAILGLLALSPVVKAVEDSAPPEISILPIIEDDGELGSKPEIFVPDIGILPIDEWGRFPGWWMPRNLYFSFNPTTRALQTFTDAQQIPGGAAALGLPMGNNGLYYGVNSWGGNDGYGSIYSLNSEGNQEELVSFSPSHDQNDFLYGAFPSNLTLSSNGSFYGTTYYGGENNGGSIFKFNPDGNTLEGVASFESAYEDEYGYSYPVLPSALTLGQNGMFYGTTSYGGEKQGGSIFTFDPTTNQLSTAFSFDLSYQSYQDEEGIEYSYPSYISPSVLTLADDGLLYGTTFLGGDHNSGSIFSFDPNQGEFAIVANFEPFFDANGFEYFPSPSSLTLGRDGLLYGTTTAGGEANLGTIFAFDPINKSLSTVVSFDTVYDENNLAFLPSPQDLKLGSDGFLYGTLHNQYMYYFMRGDGLENTLDNGQAPVPEPLTLLGTIAAINFGVFFKKRGKRQQKIPNFF